MLLSLTVFQDFDPSVNVPLRKLYRPLHMTLGGFLLLGASLTVVMGITEKAFYQYVTHRFTALSRLYKHMN